METTYCPDCHTHPQGEHTAADCREVQAEITERYWARLAAW